MLEKFVSVTRATLKGTVLIGLAQGGFIVGPILAALFVTAGELFGTALRASIAEPARHMVRDADA